MTMSGGTFAGPAIPSQMSTANPGTPDSATVATCGKVAMRLRRYRNRGEQANEFAPSHGHLPNPITGIAGCCACAASGHAAAPSSVAKNFRRSMWLAM